MSHAGHCTSTEPPVSYLVGPRPEGGWYAVETHGLGGGVFRDCASAIHYATRQARRPGPVRLVAG